MDPRVQRVQLVEWFAAGKIVGVEMPVGSGHGVVALQYDPQFPFLRKMMAFRVKEPDKVVTRHVLLAVPDDAEQDVVEHRAERVPQQIEAGEDRETLAVGLPHIERLALEKLPAVDVIGLADLTCKG